MGITVHLEVSVKLESYLGNEILHEHVINDMTNRKVQSGVLLEDFNSPCLSKNVSSVRVCEVTDDSSNKSTQIFEEFLPNESTKFILHFFRLSEDLPQSESIGGEEDTIAANFLPLPAKCLDGLWESLIYDSSVKQELLQYSKAMLYYAKYAVDPNIVNCNRVLLLHGPPGTGKTSLSKAVAQKLSIRLNSSYNQALLIEINTHSLFSKYFSESGKLVSKMFGKIKELACDPNTLLCVLIDEVESLTHSRSASSSGSEPSDSIRVVNAVLTHLDILKSYPNVLTLTTSNVTNAIDLAFVDRADLRVLIPNPSVFGVYSILYSCLEELVKRGLLTGPCPPRITSKDELKQLQSTNPEIDLISLCRNCEGLSGRALRKLPLRVHSTLVQPDQPTSLKDFVRAIFSAVEQVKEEIKFFDGSEVIVMQ